MIRLIGAPAGYVGYEVGGQLTEAVRRCPYQVVRFDEFKMVHHDVSNSLLQVLDEGRLIDFCHTVIILTSNWGSDILVGLPESTPSAVVKAEVMNVVRAHYSPEIIPALTSSCFITA